MPRTADRRVPGHALVVGVLAIDPDAPGHYQVVLSSSRIVKRLAGDTDLASLRDKYGLISEEVVQQFAPHAYRDPATDAVTLNAGYDPDHAEGRLERAIWGLVERPVTGLIRAEAARAAS